MTLTLVPCVHCARHVRFDETQCPFCEQLLAVTPLVAASTERASRAVFATLGAVLAVLPVAVFETSEPEAQSRAPTQRDAGNGASADAGVDASADAGPRRDAARTPTVRRNPSRPPRPEVVPLYGISPKNEDDEEPSQR